LRRTLTLPAVAAALFVVSSTAQAQSAFDAQQAAQAAQAAARAAQEANDIARRAAMQSTLDSMNASRASRMQALRSGSSGAGNGTTDATDATQRMIEQITRDTPVRRAVPPPRVDVWTPAKRPCPHLKGEVLPALLAKSDACGIVGASGHQQRVFFIIVPNVQGDLTPEDVERNRQLSEAGAYLDHETPAGMLYGEFSPEGIVRIIGEIEADLAAVNEKLNASQPDFSRVRALDEQIREQAAKASNVSSGSSLAYFFLPPSLAPNRSAENAKLQSLILQRVIERDAATRQHAAEHPELYAGGSTP